MKRNASQFGGLQIAALGYGNGPGRRDDTVEMGYNSSGVTRGEFGSKAGLELEEQEPARVNTPEGNAARFCLFSFVLLLCSGQ